MAPYDEDDWSDSDEEDVLDAETSVQLGIPDGPLESASDLLDAAVSRIGGHPVRYHPLPHACTLILIEYIFSNFFSDTSSTLHRIVHACRTHPIPHCNTVHRRS